MQASAPLPPPERIDIPSGALHSGTAPGEPGRDPALEPGLARVELGPFTIDTWPYPGAGAPARRGLTRFEAELACGERRGRLCTDLEWERACKGPEDDPYPGGRKPDEGCAAPGGACVSGFGVRDMGSVLEWTASDLDTKTSAAGRPAIVRGAAPDAAPAARRCARRQPLPPDTKSESVGFRCCYGPPNAAATRVQRLGPAFERASLPADALAALLAQDASTSALGSDLVYFREAEATRTVLERGSSDGRGFVITTAPLRWRPAAGAELLVVVARSGPRTSLIVAYYVLGPSRHRLASSFVMENEIGPVVLAYDESTRSRILFSTCWGCPGETGRILYREPDRVEILQP